MCKIWRFWTSFSLWTIQFQLKLNTNTKVRELTQCFIFQRFYKKAAAFVLRAVAKHSPELATSVVNCGALEALVCCLEDFDPGVKEAAAWALGYIARHNAGTIHEY